MNIHISPDDKFLDFFIENTNRFSNTENLYIVYTNKELKYSKNKSIIVIDENIEDFYNLLAQVGKSYSRIFIHFLSDFAINIINSLNIDLKIIWIFWGADGFYRIKEYSEELILEEETKKYWFKYMKSKKIVVRKNIIAAIKDYNDHNRREKEALITRNNYLKALKKIDYFAHYIPKDFSIIMKYETAPKIKYINFNYISLEQMSICSNHNNQEKVNVLIGNSATITNNHIDIFKKLSFCKLDKVDNIYCPLSYGNEMYKEEMKEKGYFYFGDKFSPLEKFMPLEEYYKLLSSINIAIYGNIRSQAAGNILALLQNGSRVYMNSKNTLYQLLKSEGVILFDINIQLKNDLENGIINILTGEEKKHNILILNNLFGCEQMEKKYNQLLNV